MTDQPTKGPYTLDEMHTDHQPRVYASEKLIACFGNAEPWAEAKDEWVANARLFVRAQHMGELVEAVEQYLSPLTETGFFAIVEQQQDRLIAFQTKASAILAKIKGAK